MNIMRCIFTQDTAFKLIGTDETLAVYSAPLLHVPCEISYIIRFLLFQNEIHLAPFFHLLDQSITIKFYFNIVHNIFNYHQNPP